MARNSKISDCVERAVKFHNFVLNNLPLGSYKNERRGVLFVALCDLTVEHHGAIITLIQSAQYDGSALALLRPLFETCARAVWALYCATDEELAGITGKRKAFPALDACTRAIQKHFAKNNYPGLFSPGRDYIDQLHGFTHSGIEQLQSRIGPGLLVKPNYSDETICKLLQQATIWMATVSIAQLHFIEGAGSDRFTKLYIELFKS
jgi:hypothetical protein